MDTKIVLLIHVAWENSRHLELHTNSAHIPWIRHKTFGFLWSLPSMHENTCLSLTGTSNVGTDSHTVDFIIFYLWSISSMHARSRVPHPSNMDLTIWDVFSLHLMISSIQVFYFSLKEDISLRTIITISKSYIKTYFNLKEDISLWTIISILKSYIERKFEEID